MNAQLLDSSDTTRAATAQADTATRDSHPPSPPSPVTTSPVLSTSVTTESTSSAQQAAPTLLDRTAMRVGLALILWGRRGHGRRPSVDDHDLNARLTRNERERLAREAVWLHTALTRR